MNTSSPPEKATLVALGWWAVLMAVVFLTWSRFAGAPVVDFTTDDWRMLELGRACTSFQDAIASMLRWPDRPFGTVALVYTFHVFDEWLMGYALVGLVSGALFLYFTMLVVLELTADRFVAYLSALLFALLPNLTETFQWATMVVYGPGYAAYPAAAWAALRYLRRGGTGWLVGSILLYAFAMGTYEVGIALAPVFAVFLLRRSRLRIASLVAGWGAVAVLYFAWKMSGCFGLVHDPLFPRREIVLGDIPWIWNTVDAARWWIGRHFWNCLLEGWKAFATMPERRQYLLLFGNLFLLVAALLTALRLKKDAPETPTAPAPYLPAEVVLFGLAWFILVQLVNLLSWSAGRLCLVPAVGAVLIIAYGLRRLSPSAWMPVLAVLGFLCLVANQGTSRQWEVAGQAHRCVFNYVRDHQSEWIEKKLIYFNTESLRLKQAGGLRADRPRDPRFWAYYGNATLFRGFVFNSIIKQLANGAPYPTVILDVEHEARIEADRALWSGWYNTSQHFETPLDQVFMVDCLAQSSYQSTRPSPATGE